MPALTYAISSGEMFTSFAHLTSASSPLKIVLGCPLLCEAMFIFVFSVLCLCVYGLWLASAHSLSSCTCSCVLGLVPANPLSFLHLTCQHVNMPSLCCLKNKHRDRKLLSVPSLSADTISPKSFEPQISPMALLLHPQHSMLVLLSPDIVLSRITIFCFPDILLQTFCFASLQSKRE